MDKKPVRVVFRKWRAAPCGVIALFPELTENGGCCVSYEHVGQHSAAPYNVVIKHTVPARRSEYSALKKELESAGYRLKRVKQKTENSKRAC
jgi:hypothetical protein